VEARFYAPSRAAPGPTQPPIWCVLYLAWEWSGWGMALTNNPHLALTLTLWSPSLSEAWSLPTCCTSHAQVQLVPTYSHMYCNVDDLNLGLGCMEAFNEQASLVLPSGDFCCTILREREKKRELSIISCYSHMICSSCCKYVLWILLEKEKEKRLCGGVLIVKCHSACQIVPHNCKHRKCVLRRFSPINFNCFYNKFFICFYRNNVFIFIFKLKYDSLSFRIW
jgi:hypothetical protein